MIFLELVGGLIALILFLFVLTQVVMPFLFNTPFFPMFKSKSPLKAQVAQAEHDLEEKSELVRLKERLFALNQEQAALEKRIAESVDNRLQ